MIVCDTVYIIGYENTYTSVNAGQAESTKPNPTRNLSVRS